MKNYTMYEIERGCPNFFTTGAKRFFNSRINMKQIAVNGFFITSEQFDHSTPRKYTIRQFNGVDRIETIGEFQDYSTLAQAKKALKEMLTV